VRFNDKANGFMGSSEKGWEPGSAMVPTFCVSVDVLNLRSVSHILAEAGDEIRDGGGDPKRESWSSSYPSVMSEDVE
jgi:hypothetical protein